MKQAINFQIRRLRAGKGIGGHSQRVKSLRIAIAFFALLGQMGCTTRTVVVAAPHSECTGVDWWEFGRQQGVAGQGLERLFSERKRCDGSENPVAVDAFKNGRDAGLIDFCKPSQAYLFGRTGGSYKGVCPQNLEAPFLSSFNVGRRVRQLELKSREIDSKISSLLDHPVGQGQAVQSQVERLRSQRTEIEIEIFEYDRGAKKF